MSSNGASAQIGTTPHIDKITDPDEQKFWTDVFLAQMPSVVPTTLMQYAGQGYDGLGPALAMVSDASAQFADRAVKARKLRFNLVDRIL